MENLDSVSGFGYWMLSDQVEETAASPQLFHGGLGLMAPYGIPKAGLFAYELLAKLGDRLICKGEGFIVTAGCHGYQVLTYNYCHFDDLYASGDTSFIHTTCRYNAFKDKKTVKREIQFTGLSEGKYRMVTYRIDRQHGSSFDRWVEMGAPEELSAEDIHYLKVSTRPQLHTRYVEVEGHLNYVSTLEPHGVELMELQRVY
ncbi:beta-xylosidase [Kroppenstedtia sanguinis]